LFAESGFVTTVGKAAGTRENEMVFWNYLVGSSKTWAEHNRRWRGRRRGGNANCGRIRYSRSGLWAAPAQASGDAAANERIALARAERIRSILGRGFGLPDERIPTESRGDTLPLADEMAPDDPRNMARDRRVEIFLFTSTRLVDKVDRVSVAFSGIASKLDTNPETRMGLAKVIGGDWVERHFTIGETSSRLVPAAK
jgi:hypothetical protein